MSVSRRTTRIPLGNSTVFTWIKYLRNTQREGTAIAKKTGKYKHVGRKPVLSGEQVSELRSKLEKGGKVAVLAREYGVSRQTIYTAVHP